VQKCILRDATQSAVRPMPQQSPVHTVAEKCDCRRKWRDSGDSRRIRRQLHFSATVWTGLKSSIRLSVKFKHVFHTGWNTSKIISRPN